MVTILQDAAGRAASSLGGSCRTGSRSLRGQLRFGRTLRVFSDKHSIQFPLLADEGSQVIRSLGLPMSISMSTTHNSAAVSVTTSAACAIRGVFVLGRARALLPSGASSATTAYANQAQVCSPRHWVSLHWLRPALNVGNEQVQVRARIDSPTYWRYRASVSPSSKLYRLWGWHVYSAPTPGKAIYHCSIRVAGTQL